MITPAQIRAARAMLDVTIDRLSQESGVSALLILQIEASNGYDATPHHYTALQQALERMGVTFLMAGEAGIGGEGLRLVAATVDEGLRPEELQSANDD
jgi:transcriptional regulator with XRE-family HTH domain